MRIAVVGTGYVGLVTGTCLAYAGHTVHCVDIDPAKVARMQAGEVPIYEPGLEEIFKENLAAKRLHITTSLSEGIEDAEVIFLALPTPPGADGAADLRFVLDVADKLGPLLKRYTVVVDKSTVPVGTGQQVAERIAAGTKVPFDVVSNPEFLREGLAVQDFLHPDRIVIGADNEAAFDAMRQVYESFVETPEQLVCMDIRSAEMTKYAANSFLAMKVSFMNEVANMCELLGANVDAVRLGIGPDKRIGDKFLRAGIGYGGSCFPKDVQALHHTAQAEGYDFQLLNSIMQVNVAQRQRMVDKVLAYFGGDVAGKHFAMWGLAFKPDTDDIREAPSLYIIERLLEAGAKVVAYDPEAVGNVRKHFGERKGLQYAKTALSATKGADALLVLTEWSEFLAQDMQVVKERLAQPVVFDGRNMWPPEQMQQAGFYYASVGRTVVNAQSHCFEALRERLSEVTRESEASLTELERRIAGAIRKIVVPQLVNSFASGATQ